MGGSLKVPRWGRGSVEGTAKQMGEGSLLSGKMREGQMSGSWWICKEGWEGVGLRVNGGVIVWVFLGLDE